MTQKELISKWIAGPFASFKVTIGKRQISGFRGTTELEIAKANEQICLYRDVARDNGYRLFCGSSQRAMVPGHLQLESGVIIFAVPKISEADIADLCDVNVPTNYNSPELFRKMIEAEPDGVLAMMVRTRGMTVDDFSGPPPSKRRQKIRKFLEGLEKKYPFEIYYAERKGLKARFLKPIDKKAAGWLEAEIAKVNIEAFDVADPLTMKEYILKYQQLILWWD